MTIIILLNIPHIQQMITVYVTQELKDILQTELTIGRITFGYPNRLIIDNVELNDRDGNELLKVSRLSAKFEIRPLLEGKITIHTAQLFGFSADLYRRNPDEASNFQFILDAFASKDTVQQKSQLDLRINTILIRRGKVAYNTLSAPETPGKFNSQHLDITNFNANLTLKSLRNDSLNASIKRLDFEEKSGLKLTNLQLKVLADKEKLTLTNFDLQLPDTRIKLDTTRVTYRMDEIDNHKFIENVCFEGKFLQSSYLTPRDISFIAPALSSFKERLNIGIAFYGNTNQLEIPYLHISSENKDVILKMEDAIVGFVPKDNPYLSAKLQKLSITTTGMHFLTRNLSKNYTATSPTLLHTGFINFSGELSGTLSNITTFGLLETGVGNIQAHMKLHMTPEKDFSYKGTISSDNLELKQLLGEEQKLGNTAFDINLSGIKSSDETISSLYIQGLFSTLQYSDYEYQNIRMDGTFNHKGFDGLLSLNDPNASLQINGQLNVMQQVPTFNLTASLSHFRPYNLHLTEKYQESEFALQVRASFSGNNLDNIDGKINIDSMSVIVPEDYFYMDNLNIHARTTENGTKLITAKSDFMKAKVEGEYAYETLPTSFIRIMEKYVPSLIQSSPIRKQRKKAATNNNFVFDFTFLDSNFYPYVLNLPLKLKPSASIKGQVNDSDGKMKLEGYFPSLSYGSGNYESGLLLCENNDKEFVANLSVSKQMAGNARVTMSMKALAGNDKLKTRLSWGNDTEVTYCGNIETETKFYRTEKVPTYLQADIQVKPTEVILNDTIWNIRESAIAIDSGKVYIDKFLIEHEHQHLLVNGKLTSRPEDSLLVELNQIKLEYIFDILQFHPVDFAGIATGKAYISQALNNPQADTRLFVKNFNFNGGSMGDMNIYGRWDNKEGILLDADIKEEDLSHTMVKGFVNPMENGLDLNIYADNTNLEFLNSFIDGIFSNIKGRGTGYVHLHGPFNALNLEGDVLADATAKVDILNTDFTLMQDSVHFRKNEILFPDVTIYDMEGHSGTVNGYLRHEHLGNMSYYFRMQANNLLVYNGKESEEIPFYGTVYATGTAILSGGSGALNVNANIRTNKRTTFIYNAASPDEITNNEFITFIDKTPRPQQHDLPLLFRNQQKNEKKNNDTPLDIRIHVTVDATPDATVKVIMDQRAGDYVLTHGRGTISADYFNKGAFTMQGTYTVNDGVYKMSMQEVIRKDFQIQQGSEVGFNGDPYQADLNMKAVYTVNSASLSDLAPDISFSQNTVKVNCIIHLTGKLFSPDLSFDLELPTVNEEEREIVRSAISTEEQMKTQIIYLLGIGKFYTYDYANNDGRSSNAMTSLLSSTLSGQLNNMLSQALNLNNWNFSSNLSTGERGWTDVEVEGILSGRLLNNRLLINGNFGYRENQLANSNFVGDFNMQWLLTPSGDISLKAYNQTNDRYFAKTTFTTQGVGIIFKREFDKWKDLFWFKKRRNEKK